MSDENVSNIVLHWGYVVLYTKPITPFVFIIIIKFLSSAVIFSDYQITQFS